MSTTKRLDGGIDARDSHQTTREEVCNRHVLRRRELERCSRAAGIHIHPSRHKGGFVRDAKGTVENCKCSVKT